MDLSSTIIPALCRATLPKVTLGTLSPPSPPEAFVIPSVSMKEGGFDARKPILIVSAPGAVGKSALAHYIADRSSTLVWDLSRLVVGDNTFLGTVAKAFGTSQLTHVLSAFQAGKCPFVFDALDEAEVLSGWNMLERFVTDISDQLISCARPSAVFFARSETAALLDMLLSDRHQPPVHQVIEIEHFDESRARDFIQKAVAQRRGQAPQSRSAPLDDAATTVFRSLARSMSVDVATLWDPSTGRHFFGYAPVLQAIATYLSEVDNLAAFCERESHPSQLAPESGLAKTVVSELLNREQQKLIGALRNKQLPGSTGYGEWAGLYGATEQVERLLAYCERSPAATTPPSNVPTWLMKEYAEALRNFLPNHPFLANQGFAGPAFRDFAIAIGLRATPVLERAERLASDNTYLPTPLLSAFYRDLSPSPARGSHVGVLYESATAGSALGDEPLTTVIGNKSNPSTHLLSVVVDDRPGTAPANDFEIAVEVTREMPISLRRRIRNAQIETPGTVILGQASGPFELANTEIECDTIDIRARELQLRALASTDRVAITAQSAQTPSTAPRVQSYGEGSIQLSWPGVKAYPWTAFAAIPSEGARQDLSSRLDALRSILRWFRRDRKEQFAKHREHIDNNVVNGRPIRELVLRGLLRDGVITSESYLYVLHPDKARKVGIDWTRVVKRRELNDRLIEFLKSL